jgi:hypothetical protein
MADELQPGRRRNRTTGVAAGRRQSTGCRKPDAVGGTIGDADCSQRKIRAEWILKWRQLIIRRAGRDVSVPGPVAAQNGGCNRMRPLAKDGLTTLKEDQQVGGSIVVDVLDGTHPFARRGIEFLDEIDTVVEVAVRLATHEGATFVILVNIGSAVEIGIEGHLGELAVTIVGAPDVGPSVAVMILRADVAGWPQRRGRGRNTCEGAQAHYKRAKGPLFHRYDATQRTRANEGPQPILRDLSFGTHLSDGTERNHSTRRVDPSAALGHESAHCR